MLDPACESRLVLLPRGFQPVWTGTGAASGDFGWAGGVWHDMCMYTVRVLRDFNTVCISYLFLYMCIYIGSTKGTNDCENRMFSSSADAAAALRLRSSAPLAVNSTWDW